MKNKIIIPRNCGKSRLMMKEIFKLIEINLEDVVKIMKEKENKGGR